MIDPEKYVNTSSEALSSAPEHVNHAGEPPPQSVAFSGQPDDLHDLFASVPNSAGEEEDPLAAMRNDPNYAALIKELEYIARQAKELFSNVQEAPSDSVWKKITDELPHLGGASGTLSED